MPTHDLENYFRELSNKLYAFLQNPEILLINLRAENSDFVRLNQNKIRQAGNVNQQSLRLNLIADNKQSSASFNLSGDIAADLSQAKKALTTLRDTLPFLPDDPFLNYATQPNNSSHIADNTLPPPEDTVGTIMDEAEEMDLVGIWASGEMCSGFSNSVGQFNWHQIHNFNFDWSVYHHTDKAIKQNYAGIRWEQDQFLDKMEYARQTMALLAKPTKTIMPGKYRAYLTPSALQELLALLSWGGFGLKSHRTKQTPLLKMVNDGIKLHQKVNFTENHIAGLTPKFTSTGFIKPENVTLINSGKFAQCLTNTRSAKEYNETVNCNIEHPESLQIGSGELPQRDILKALHTGVFISNLWYCNYSDRNNCRITGMTRFACLWVENGVPVAPLSVMRFDESVYQMLGIKLEDLTEQKEYIFDSSTYHNRSTTSSFLPGALINDFTFTL